MATPENVINQGVEIISQNWEVAVIGASLVIGALTFKQREAIRERDRNTCQAPFPHRCSITKDKYRGNVHHIIPQAHAEHTRKEPEEVRDSPERVLLICETAHDMIHPDREAAQLEFRYNKDAYKKMHEYHEEKAKTGEKYWFDKWDGKMLDRAKKNTEQSERKGWKFPPKLKR